jgi:hypothetical protein
MVFSNTYEPIFRQGAARSESELMLYRHQVLTSRSVGESRREDASWHVAVPTLPDV